MEHSYCFVPKPLPQKNNQINGLTSTQNFTSGQSSIVSPTVSQVQSKSQYNVTNSTRGK